MQSGQFSTIAVFQRRGTTQDASGQPSQTYTEFYRSGVAISPISGREAIDSGLETAESGIRVTVRFGPTSSTIQTNDRMLVQGSPYTVTYARPSFNREHITLIGRADR